MKNAISQGLSVSPKRNPDVPTHEGISFLLFSMDDPGVTVQPILLISGQSPFCQCFFDNVKVPKTDLIGQENRGWTIAKRLLQHERAGIAGLTGGGRRTTGRPVAELALEYAGVRNGHIADLKVRNEVARLNMEFRVRRLNVCMNS